MTMKNEEIKMNLTCKMIELYKYLIFEKKEFIISKRILKIITDLGSLFSAKNQNETFEITVEINFWTKVLIKNEDDGQLKQIIEDISNSTKSIIKEMEENV